MKKLGERNKTEKYTCKVLKRYKIYNKWNMEQNFNRWQTCWDIALK